MREFVARERKISKAEYEELAAFRYALRQFLHFSEQAAASVDLTPQQHQALLAIMGYPGRDRVLIGELAERLQIRHQSAVELVDRLHLRGYVDREHDTADKRQVYVTLTEKGLEMLDSLTATHREELRRIGPQLNLLLQRLSQQQNEI